MKDTNKEKENKMTLQEKLEYCKNCSYCVWLIGIGQGVRCHHLENQQYLPEGQRSPVLIGEIPDGCEFQNNDKLNK